MKPLTRRTFGRLTALAAGALSLGGCAPQAIGERSADLGRTLDDPLPTPFEWRVLNRVAYGPRPGDVAQLRQMGTRAYIEQQLSPESIAESPALLDELARLETLNDETELVKDHEQQWQSDDVVAPVLSRLAKFPGGRRNDRNGQASQELAQAAVLRAALSERQLLEIMVEFWGDHFNVDQTKGACRWLKTVDDRMLRTHALGKFRELLGVSAHSPAMLVYLDNAQNRRPDSRSGAGLNENYARELLELHTLGSTSLYTLRDIQEVARCFTGWTVEESWNSPESEFAFHAGEHDDGSKQVLGYTITAEGGQADGERVLDILARHPSTARTIASKLCRRFLGGTEPSALVDRLAHRFTVTEGDIRQVLAELLHSDEFRDSPTRQFKRPFHYAVSSLRVLGARCGADQVLPYLEAMGQRPFQWAMPDGYPESPDAWTPSLLARWKFARDLIDDRIERCWINFDSLELAVAGRNLHDVRGGLAARLLGGPLPDELVTTPTVADVPGKSAAGLRQWLALLVMSPQFQWC